MAEKLMDVCAWGSAATSGASRNATAPTNTAFTRMGRAVEEKKGAKATMPLMRTRASVIALRNVGQSVMHLPQAELAELAALRAC